MFAAAAVVMVAAFAFGLFLMYGSLVLGWVEQEFSWKTIIGLVIRCVIIGWAGHFAVALLQDPET
jgi:hypothetical protein